MARQHHEMVALGDRLRARRRRRFVGRTAEQELLRGALAADQPSFAVLYVHGPGGIGKTTLLERYADIAEATDAVVVRVTGGTSLPAESVVLDRLRGAVEVPVGEDPIRVRDGRRLVLLIDGYEHFAAIDAWIRTSLLPRLPATALTVLAGRAPPPSAWRADAAWRDLLRVVAVRNLGPSDCRLYLERCNIPAELHERIFMSCHGHPLGLSLMADVVARTGSVAVDPLTPQLVTELLRQFLGTVPTATHRQALEACAIARVTTASLLRDVLGIDDPTDQFSWLRDLSFVHDAPDGLQLHELARDVLQADLRWRDPTTHHATFRAVRDHVLDRLRATAGREQQIAAMDLKYLFRHLPSVMAPVDWDAWGQQVVRPATDADRGEVLDIVARAEGPAGRDLLNHWWDHQPEAVVVVTDAQGVRGVIVLLDLTAATEEERCRDPGAQAAWDYATAQAPPRAGERITQTRIVVDRKVYQDPSPTMNAVPVLTLQRYLAMPDLAWDFLTLDEPERWDEYFALADFPRAEGADFEIAGVRFGLFAHDFRAVDVHALVHLWTERALALDDGVEPGVERDLHVLSHEEFTPAVRQGLRDLRRPDLLDRNALVRTRLVARCCEGEPDGVALQGLLGEAIDALAEDPRDDKQLRALRRTYVNPAPTQEAAAEVLGLPFGTYRRHLRQGVERVTEWLWDREVYGPDPTSGQ